VHSGANYWFGSGVDGNHLTTPTSTANSNNGNKEIIAQVDCQGTAFYTFASKNNQAYCFFLLNGVFRFNATTDLLGLTQYSATASVATNFSGWVKCTAEFSTGILTIKFFTSTDGVTYTQIGSNVTGVGNNFINTGGTLYVGSINGGSDFRGRIHRVTIANSVNGAPVVDFNPNTYNAATSQTSWTSATGEVWTINQSVGNTLKGTIVDRTKTQFVRGLYSMQTGTGTVFLTGNNVTYSEYVAAQLSENLSQSSPVTLKGVGSAQIDFGTTSAIQFYAQDNAGAVRRFDPSFSFSYLLNIFNIIGDSTTTAYLNNVAGSSSSNAQTTTTINQVSLSGSSNYNNFTGVFNTLILTSQADNSTQRTAIWNIIKIINNL
jgi:hypothetical protein